MSAHAEAVRRASDRPFYASMAVAMLLTVLVGFAPTFYLRSAFGTAPSTPLVQLHGILFSAWMLLFLTQTVLVAQGKTAVHRRLGVGGAMLTVALLVVGVMTAIAAAKRGIAPGGADPLRFLAIPLTTISVFAATVGAAIHLRRRSEFHKRLMLVATIGIMTPAIVRMLMHSGMGASAPPVGFVLTDLFFVPCLIVDRLRYGKIHPAFLWGIGALIVSQVGRVVVMRTDAWMAIANWLTR